MKRVFGVLLLCTAVAVTPSSASAKTNQLRVELDRTEMAVKIGQRFDFTSTITNDSDQPLKGVVAHLNVLGLDPSIYVDPEDWSSDRTQFVGDLAAQDSTELDWEVQAVSPGALAIYVTVTSQQGPNNDVVASKAIRMSVGQARKLNATESAPLVLGMPAGVGLLLALTMARRRRLR